jgi:hypothetical protein
MSRDAAAFTGQSGAAARSAEWLSEDWPRGAGRPLVAAGSHPTSRPRLSPRPLGVRRLYTDDRPRGPPKSAGPECTRPSDPRSNRK